MRRGGTPSRSRRERRTRIARASSLAEYERRCRDAGLRLTVQRRAVLEALLSLDHPTADRIFAGVLRRLPGVSRTTIYRTVEQLVSIGLLGKACHPGAVVRYDTRTEPHHHLVCVACETIVDFDDRALDVLPIPDTRAHDFRVRDIRVQLRGLCGRCQAKRTRNRKEDSA